MGRGDDRRAALAAQGLDGREVFHLTALENVSSIMASGVLPHSTMRRHRHVDISLQSAQAKRSTKRVATGPGATAALHDLVPLFFTWSTPMVIKRARQGPDLALLVFDLADLCGDEFEVAFTSMNAASSDVRFEHDFDRIGTHVPWAAFKPKYWGDLNKERGAELLVAPSIPPSLVRRIEVRDADTASQIALDERVWWSDRVRCVPEHFFDTLDAKYGCLEAHLFESFLPYDGEAPISVTMTLGGVSAEVGGLPDAAYATERWWSANGTPQSRAWRDYTVSVDLDRETVTFSAKTQ